MNDRAFAITVAIGCFVLSIIILFAIPRNDENRKYKNIILEYIENVKTDDVTTFDIIRKAAFYHSDGKYFDKIARINLCKNDVVYTQEGEENRQLLIKKSDRKCSEEKINNDFNEFVKKRLGENKECKICIDMMDKNS